MSKKFPSARLTNLKALVPMHLLPACLNANQVPNSPVIINPVHVDQAGYINIAAKVKEIRKMMKIITFKTLVHGSEIVDPNELDHGIYGTNKPVLYNSNDTLESIISRHEDIHRLLNDYNMAEFRKNIGKCSLKECVLIINS